MNEQDQELVDAMREQYQTAIGEVEEKLDARWQQKFIKFAQENARHPLALAGSEIAPESYAAQLTKDGAFKSWLASRDRRSRLVKQLQLRAAITSAGFPTMPARVPGITSTPLVPLRLRDFIPAIPVGAASAVEYVKGTLTNNAAIQQEEGDKKAESVSGFTAATAKILTVAHFSKASTQMVADVPALSQWLETQLIYGVELKEEAVLVNGDATAAVDGLLTVATAPPAAFVPTGTPTIIDKIGGGIAALLAAGFAPDTVVMNAADAFAARLVKDSTGRYLWAPAPAGALSATSGWATQVVIAPSLAAGTAPVCALRQACFLADRETATVDIPYENEDDFVKNLVCFRAELRSGLAIPVPSGIVKVALAAA